MNSENLSFMKLNPVFWLANYSKFHVKNSFIEYSSSNICPLTPY